MIQFGGQTPLKLARAIEAAGFKVLGTPYEAVDLAEDRERFGLLLDELGVRCPEWGIADAPDAAVEIAGRVGYPVLVRPSYVLGGRAMRVCYDEAQVRDAMAGVTGPALVDRFLEGALEIDVDALCDGVSVHIGAVMEHVEEAGIHSGDSSCVLPAPSLDEETYAEVCRVVRRLGPALGVVGLLNVQLALVDGRGLGDRGQPARLPHGAVREQGDRRSTSSTRPSGSPPARACTSSSCPRSAARSSSA